MRAPITAASVAALLLLPTAAQASTLPREAPLLLPAPATARAAKATRGTWLVGARPGARATRVAAAAGARPVGLLPGAFVVSAARAGQVASALRRAGLLVYAEPNARYQRRSAFESNPAGWARGAIVPPTLAWPVPPPTTIAVVDDMIDQNTPDVGPQTTYPSADRTVLGPHGTMVASAAAAASGNGGVIGVLPGARLLSVPLGETITCSAAAQAILEAANAKATVINLSFGGDDCYSLWRAVELAFGAGSVVVAAAGNEYASGNPVEYPAGYPHVVSVAAVDQSLASAAFSNANRGVDVAAPGVDVPLAIPLAFDTTDGAQDGVTTADGTSFASPMVAGAAAWVAALHPNYSPGQIADALRYSARDLGRRGYDSDTGFGLVDVARALTAPTPAYDPSEPNDGISFVDGGLFSRPDPYLWRGGAASTIGQASVDRWEDPFDVYRVQLPRRSRVSVKLTPRHGDPDVYVFDGGATSLTQRRKIIGRSVHSGSRTDRVVVVNSSRRTRRAYVVVAAAGNGGNIDASYKLTVGRAGG
jgi:hypothetical protein